MGRPAGTGGRIIDRKYLRKQGIWSGAFKAIWSQDYAKLTPRQQSLLDLLRNRNNDSYQLGFKEWRAYHAIDLAYEVPWQQTTATFVNNILSKNLSAEDVVKELDAYGLSKSSLMREVELEDGKKVLTVDPQVLYQTAIPLVRSYTDIRRAKLFNERNTNPIIPFKPMVETARDQILCEIWSFLINKVGKNYGYPTVLRQAIGQMLKYGIALAFPREEWHVDRQIMDFGNGPEDTIIKEGLRYIIPHPTRQGYDLHYPTTSFNTDSGCEWGLHWTVARYGDILDNRMYWNRKKIFAGTNWFLCPAAEQYFKEVFPCTMKFPVDSYRAVTRDDKAAYYNSNNDRDSSVFLSTQFVKVIPRAFDLGDYKYPVWLRFDIAGPDTIIWSDVCSYNPVLMMGYDWDDNASKNSSLALELIPWQDQLGNILSQMLLTAKQNLANVVFYNTQVVDRNDIKRMNNSGEKKYREWNWVGFDAMKMAAARIDMDKVFHTVQFNKQTIQEHLQMVPMLLSIMERVIQMAAQEAGAAASHQQSKAEIIETGGASTNRLVFTGSYIDEFIDAWGRQNHDAGLAYFDPKFIAEVSADIPDIEQHLDALGLKIKSRTPDKITVEGAKSVLRVESFASSYKGPEPTREKEMAQVIFQTVGVVAGQEDLHKKVGARNLLKLVERAALMAGAPKDFRLPILDESDNNDIPAAIQQAIEHAQQATLQAIEEKIGKPAAQASARDEQRIGALEEVVKKLQAIYQIAADTQEKGKIKAAETQQKMEIRDAQAQADEKRKQERHALDLKIATEKAQTDIGIDKAKAHVKLGVDKAAAVSKVAATRAATAAKLEAAAAKPEPKTDK